MLNIPLIKYGNDDGMLVLISHPQAFASGGVSKKLMQELVEKQEQKYIEFAVELNLTIFEFNVPFLSDKMMNDLLLYAQKIPLVAAQDAHDGLLVKSYTLISKQVLVDLHNLSANYKQAIYNNEHAIVFQNNPLTHSLSWIIGQRIRYDSKSILSLLKYYIDLF